MAKVILQRKNEKDIIRNIEGFEIQRSDGREIQLEGFDEGGLIIIPLDGKNRFIEFIYPDLSRKVLKRIEKAEKDRILVFPSQGLDLSAIFLLAGILALGFVLGTFFLNLLT